MADGDDKEPVSLDERRWEQDTRADQHKPQEALKAAMRKHDKDGFDHVVIILGRRPENPGDAVEFSAVQAGSFNAFEIEGLVAMGTESIRDRD